VTQLVPEPHVLFVCVPMMIDPQGCRHTDPLWIKDLALHLEYLENMALGCPVTYGPPGPGMMPMSGPPFDRLELVLLPAPRGRLGALLALPRAVATAWRAIGKAQIVHTGFGGWPLNEGWIACPIAKLRGKFLIELNPPQTMGLQPQWSGGFLCRASARRFQKCC
jgi:hypothetical protein